MLLTIDIGNTNISFGIFKEDRLLKAFSIPVKQYTFGELRKIIGKLKIKDAIICSVVPKLTGVLAKELKRLLYIDTLILGSDINAPIKNLYRKPWQVGQDRLVNAYAGIRIYGAPLIVVDLGTAVTFDVISRREEYLGGMILPGLQTSLLALYEHTALLPKIKLHPPKEFIGLDTQSSMISGIVYGFAGIIDDLSERLKEKIGKHAKVIGTGGNIDLIAKYCRKINVVDRFLTLKGLEIIFSSCKKSIGELESNSKVKSKKVKPKVKI